MAFLQGRGYVTPQDVKDIALDVLRQGVTLKDGPARPARVRRIEAPPGLLRAGFSAHSELTILASNNRFVAFKIVNYIRKR